MSSGDYMIARLDSLCVSPVTCFASWLTTSLSRSLSLSPPLSLSISRLSLSRIRTTNKCVFFNALQTCCLRVFKLGSMAFFFFIIQFFSCVGCQILFTNVFCGLSPLVRLVEVYIFSHCVNAKKTRVFDEARGNGSLKTLRATFMFE